MTLRNVRVKAKHNQGTKKPSPDQDYPRPLPDLRRKFKKRNFHRSRTRTQEVDEKDRRNSASRTERGGGRAVPQLFLPSANPRPLRELAEPPTRVRSTRLAEGGGGAGARGRPSVSPPAKHSHPERTLRRKGDTKRRRKANRERRNRETKNVLNLAFKPQPPS